MRWPSRVTSILWHRTEEVRKSIARKSRRDWRRMRWPSRATSILWHRAEENLDPVAQDVLWHRTEENLDPVAQD
jgi:hypothetical protein